MIQNQTHSQLQSSGPLLCPRHNEVVKGICLFTSKCDERLMCRTCRRTHDSLHLNYYEELDDLYNGKLVNDVRNDFDDLLKKIDKQNSVYENNSRVIFSQIDCVFREIQIHILQNLLQTRDMLITTINERLEKNLSLKQNLIGTLNEISRAYERITSSKFNIQSTADDMVKAICNAQILKDVTSKDPELQAQETIGFNPSQFGGNLFQQIKTALDQICKDISNCFVADKSGKVPSVPKGSLLQGGPMPRLPLLEDQNLIMSMGGPPDMYGQRRAYGTEMYNSERQNEQYGTGGLPRTSPFNKVTQGEEKARVTPKNKSTTPSKILQLFQVVSQEEGGKGGSNIGESEREMLNNQLMSLMQEEIMQGEKGQKGGKRNELLEYRDRINTNHKQIMFGGLVYVAAKEHLVTAGTEGSVQVFSMKNMQSLHSFKAHSAEILRMLYIPERDLLLTAAIDGGISMWDYKQKCKFVQQFKEHTAPVYALEYLGDSELVVSGGEDETIRMWSINTGKQQHTMKTTNSKIGAFCKLERGRKIAVGFDKGHINIIVLGQTRKVAYTIKAHNSFVGNMATVSEQNLLISCADEGIKIWRLYETKAEFVRMFSQDGTMLRDFLLFKEKDLLISNHDDNQVRLWSLSTGKKLEDHFDKTFGEGMVALYNRDEIATANLKEIKLWVING